MPITNCLRCGRAYEEASEEAANDPDPGRRVCAQCFSGPEMTIHSRMAPREVPVLTREAFLVQCGEAWDAAVSRGSRVVAVMGDRGEGDPVAGNARSIGTARSCLVAGLCFLWEVARRQPQAKPVYEVTLRAWQPGLVDPPVVPAES